VAEAADTLRARIDALEADLAGLIANLRDETERRRGDLAGLAAGAAELPRGADAAAAPPGVAPSALGATVGSVPPVEEAAEVDDEPALAAVDEDSGGGGRSRDVDGARIVALERALSGEPREQTDRLLAEHYDLPDRAALVDEAYRAAEQR
jgi:hypothetical protein